MWPVLGAVPCAVVDLICTWAQDERPADLHMAQPNVPVSKTGHIPPARLVRGSSDAGRPHRLSTIGKLVYDPGVEEKRPGDHRVVPSI
jgi:hypothetical protein